MEGRRTASRVVTLGLALALVATGLALVETDAAWRRVTRNFEAPFVNDLRVCTDGIEFVLGTTLQPDPPPEPPDTTPPPPPPETFPTEALRITTGIDPGFGGEPSGTDLLLLEQGWGDPMPQVPLDDPLLDGFVTNPDRTAYAIAGTRPWSEPVAAGSVVYLWLLLGGDVWRSANLRDAEGNDVGTVVEDCRLFEPEPVTAELDANVFDPGNSTYPQSLDVTVFRLTGVEPRLSSVRFGAAGQETPAYMVQLGDEVYGVADLRARGLDCSVDTASVVGETADGSPFAATDAIRPICK